MPTVTIDPQQPLTIEATYDTPLRVNVDYLVKRAGSTQWHTFYSAKVSQDVPSQVVRTTIEKLPVDSEILLTAVYAGAKNTSFRSSIRFLQGEGQGHQLGKPITANGSTGTKYAKYDEVEVTLA